MKMTKMFILFLVLLTLSVLSMASDKTGGLSFAPKIGQINYEASFFAGEKQKYTNAYISLLGFPLLPPLEQTMEVERNYTTHRFQFGTSAETSFGLATSYYWQNESVMTKRSDNAAVDLPIEDEGFSNMTALFSYHSLSMPEIDLMAGVAFDLYAKAKRSGSDTTHQSEKGNMADGGYSGFIGGSYTLTPRTELDIQLSGFLHYAHEREEANLSYGTTAESKTIYDSRMDVRMGLAGEWDFVQALLKAFVNCERHGEDRSQLKNGQDVTTAKMVEESYLITQLGLSAKYLFHRDLYLGATYTHQKEQDHEVILKDLSGIVSLATRELRDNKTDTITLDFGITF